MKNAAAWLALILAEARVCDFERIVRLTCGKETLFSCALDALFETAVQMTDGV